MFADASCLGARLPEPVRDQGRTRPAHGQSASPRLECFLKLFICNHMGKLICVAAISKIIVMQALYMLLNTGAYSISVGAAPYVTISPNKCSHIPYVFWGFTHFLIEFCRDRRCLTFVKILSWRLSSNPILGRNLSNTPGLRKISDAAGL